MEWGIDRISYDTQTNRNETNDWLNPKKFFCLTFVYIFFRFDFSIHFISSRLMSTKALRRLSSVPNVEEKKIEMFIPILLLFGCCCCCCHLLCLCSSYCCVVVESTAWPIPNVWFEFFSSFFSFLFFGSKNWFLFARVNHLCPCRIETKLLFAFIKVFSCFVQKQPYQCRWNEEETNGRNNNQLCGGAMVVVIYRCKGERERERVQNTNGLCRLRRTNFLMATKILIFSDSFDVVGAFSLFLLLPPSVLFSFLSFVIKSLKN